jgi:hypothetical protein
MTDRNEEPHLGKVASLHNSSCSVSRRAFLGMAAGSGMALAAAGAATTGNFPATSAGEGDPVNLLPRLSPPPKSVAGIARPMVELKGTWRFNPNPAAEFWKDASDAGWSDIQVAGDQRYSIQRRIGFRQVGIQDGRFLLNGQPIRLRGVVRQDSHPLMGRTVPSEVQRQDIQWMLWANANNTYTCAFPPDEEVLDLCDEAGLYAMDEPGTCWVGLRGENLPALWQTERFDDPRHFP